MKIGISLFVLVLFIIFSSRAQNYYELDLKADKWNFKPTLFYISEILDERNNKSNAGQVLSGGKSITAKFKNSLKDDLEKLLLISTQQDTTKIPLILSIDKFSIKETGTPSHHKAIFDFSLKIYRIIHEKRFQMYEVNGKPEMDIHGPYPNVHEKNIRESLRRSIKDFNSWLNEHPDQSMMAKKVVIIFDSESTNKSRENGDTILWNENYRLKWSDFKGKPDASSFMAQSNCLFTYRAETVVKQGILELHIIMNAGFERTSSWVKNNQQKDTLLAHEQLHFDICELNIRSLRKKLLSFNLDILEYSSQVKTSFDLAWKDYQDQQQRYDDETGHGIISDKQQYWQTDIREKLER